MARFERLTKRAVSLSAIVIAGLLIGLHPDVTPGLQVLATLSMAAGWLAAGAPRAWVIGAWAVLAIVAPAPLRLLAGREGPVLDLFWMAGLTASLLRATQWSGWSLPPATRVLAGAWALTLALGWPVVAARELAFDPRLLFDSGAINAWTGWNAAHVASWIAFVAWTHLLGLLWLDWMAERFAAVPGRAPRIVHALWIATTAASVIAIYQGLVDPSALNTPFWAERMRASGTMLDANAYGMCAALAGASAFLALRASASPRAFAIASAVTAINVAGLWMSGARVSALAGAVALAAIGVAVWRAGALRRIVGLAAAGATVAAILAATSATGPVRRLFERPEGVTDGFVSFALTRGPYGQAANEMMRDHPLTGVGIGMYQHLAADYQRRRQDQELPFDNAQNWWRHQAAELGVLGGLPLLAWSLVLAWQVLTARSRRDQLFTATLVRGLLLALGLCSIFQVPTQTPIVLCWFFVFVAWLPHVVTGAGRDSAAGRGVPVVVTALAVAYAAGHAVLGAGSLAVAERAKTFRRPYVVGAYGTEMTEGGSRFQWTREQARFIWPTRTPWFVISMWAHHPDIARDPVTVTVATPCQTLLEQALTGPQQLSLGLMLPEGQPWLDATVRVSRTWRPASFGDPDSRTLGVGISADSVDSVDRAQAAHVVRAVPPCPAGR